MRRWGMAAVGLAVAIVGTLVVWYVHSLRPSSERERQSGEVITASGECAECHARVTPAIVRQHLDGKHAKNGVTCIDCHRARPMADTTHTFIHRGYRITRDVTSGSCAECHAGQYRQFVRSRHAAPSWTAVRGTTDFTAAQIAEAARFHPDAMNRPANALSVQEGPEAIRTGCNTCHAVGRPNYDGSIGKCAVCHAGHEFSLAGARISETCGGCHMGPDHSQIEIWSESKHGVVFNIRRDRQKLDTPTGRLTAWDMDAPTCATCHFSGMGSSASTHDVGERLTYYLFAAISEKRPGYTGNMQRMKDVCLNCHASTRIDRFYVDAEAVLEATNAKVRKAQALYDELKAGGLLSPGPFDEPADFIMFDLWHYYGRTAKHGAYMGGADFVQWHGNYEIEVKSAELTEIAAELRRGHRAPGRSPSGAGR